MRTTEAEKRTNHAHRDTRKRGLTHSDVVAAGMAVLDAEGVIGLSLAGVAERLGVRPPSLYAHVEGLNGLTRDLAHAATVEFGEVLRDSVLGRSGADAVRSFAVAYRRWATGFPGRYEMTLLPIAPEDAERRAGARLALGAIRAIIRGFGLDEDRAVQAGRSLRSAMDGFSRLENAGSMGRGDHDADFNFLVELLIDGIDQNGTAPGDGSREDS
ncbi:MAG: TetR family transcriptional regulator [Acidimicrobiaceae bacterium]|nr:TetR family transcriptional regulator [Acidimicrobiaceae bacterium]|tara:strand:+ start:670 stop:1311 length:642 start_codon:yes stop_codon:yes gene_type:complete